MQSVGGQTVDPRDRVELTERRRLRVILVTGIYPPDIGGPATHVVDLAEELSERGHEATVLTLWDQQVTNLQPRLIRFPRRWPWPVRAAAVVAWLVRHRNDYDVVYATGLQAEAVVGSRIARRPVVVKIVGDPAWERGRRLGLTTQEFIEFQRSEPETLALRAMCTLRNWSVRTPTQVIVPSEFLAQCVEGWRGKPGVRVIPNAVRTQSQRTGPPRRGALKDLIVVSRLTEHKRIDVVIEAVAATAGVHVEIVGDGPDRNRLEAFARRLGVGSRVAFAGSMSHDAVMTRLAEADALISASSYEGLPHVVIEALTVGTPVITSAAGGIPEVLDGGTGGVIVNPATPESFARVLGDLHGDPRRMQELREGARVLGSQWAFSTCADRIERLLAQCTASRPGAVFVGKEELGERATVELRRKHELMAGHLSATIVGVGSAGVRKSSGVRLIVLPDLRPPMLGGCFYYPAASMLAVSLTAFRERRVIVCGNTFAAAAVIACCALLPTFARPRVVVEVHGEWTAATDLYGSPARRVLTPAVDHLARFSLRRADRIRVISSHGYDAVRRAGAAAPIDQYMAFTDFGLFLDDPPLALPEHPVVLFAGALEPTKAVDVLLSAWPAVTRNIPDARLLVAGNGSLRSRLERQAAELGIAGSVTFLGAQPRREIRQLLDHACVLTLPSRSEGLGRIVLEAMARGRPVVGTQVGGIPDVVQHDVNGLLVAAEDPCALADALARLLGDQARLEAMGRRAREAAERRNPLREFEEGIASLAAWAARA